MTDNKTLLEACEQLTHAAYWYAQEVIGVEDGGYASIFDCETGGKFGGNFADRVGGDVLARIQDKVGEEAFAAKAGGLFDMNLMPGISVRVETADAGEIDTGAAEVAECVIGHLRRVFPAVDVLTDGDRQNIREFMREYMSAELRMANSFSL